MASAHLSLRSAGDGADVRRIFSGQAATSRWRVLSGAVVHVLAMATLVVAARMIPDRVYTTVLPQRMPVDLVYVAQPGPGGGGGGGDRSREPPPPAELKGTDRISVPAITPPDPQPVEPEKIPDTLVEPQLNVPLAALAGSTQVRLGDLLGGDPAARGRGPGDGDGAGRGKGPGAGDGDDGGTGVGPYQIGNGVLPPRVKRSVDPQYTAEAMRAKIQGAVLLAAVVQPDGRVTDIRVVRSLDRSFGLDLKAVEAARKWEFYPGTRFGMPVPVLVNFELEFNLR
jgi:TonB family protein